VKKEKEIKHLARRKTMKVLAKSNQPEVKKAFVGFGFVEVVDGIFEMEAPEGRTTLRWLNPLEPILHKLVGGAFAICPYLPAELPEDIWTVIVVDDFGGDKYELLDEIMEALSASSLTIEAPMSSKEKIEKIIENTGWKQKDVALKCGRDAAAITRIMNGEEPRTKSFQARIDDLYHEVFELKLWHIEILPELDDEMPGAGDSLRITFRWMSGDGLPERTIVDYDQRDTIQQRIFQVCKLNNVHLNQVASAQVIRRSA